MKQVSKLGNKVDPFKVAPLTPREKKLHLSNAVTKEINALANSLKAQEVAVKKTKQQMAYLRSLLAQPAKPQAKKPGPKPVAKKAAAKPAAKTQAAKVEKKTEAAPAPVVG